ncbi:hypothetical protein BDR03DRAFT_295571 [Suillus americanus]|nr:hypothetical protein BDR03DRAFT_295571 [Suillus americanus]
MVIAPVEDLSDSIVHDLNPTSSAPNQTSTVSVYSPSFALVIGRQLKYRKCFRITPQQDLHT